MRAFSCPVARLALFIVLAGCGDCGAGPENPCPDGAGTCTDACEGTLDDAGLCIPGGPPVFVSTPVLDATEDELFQYAVSTADPDAGATLAITAPTLPAWLTLTDHGDGTATLSGTPTNAEVGPHPVVLQVSDGDHAVMQAFTVTVANVNDAPTILSSAPTSATVAAAYAYEVTASDVDTGAVLSFTAPTLPEWLTLTDHGDGTATLAGTPGPEHVGLNDVQLQVSDGTLAGSQAFSITVDAVPGTPLFISAAPTSATEDEPYAYAITALDPDSLVALSFTAPGLPAWLSLDDHGDGTATLAGTPTNADVGSVEITLFVSDGTLVGAQVFTLVVANTNDAPSFVSTAVTSASEDAPYTYAIEAADPDLGDALTITAPTLPGWLVLTDRGDGTASLEGTPTQADVGIHAVVLEVSDGETAAQQMFSIEVVATDDPPVFTSTPGTDATEDELYVYAVTAVDPDGTTALLFSAPTLPAWLVLTDHGDGTATLSGTPTNDDVGLVEVALSVADALASATQTFSITVANTNDAPSFTSTPLTGASEGALYTYAITVTDPDPGATTFVITAPTLPSWLVLTDHGDGTATLEGTPSASDLGQGAVTLQVSDGETSTAQTFTLTVVEANDPPSIDSTALTSATQDALYTYVITASDPDTGATLTITAPTRPDWLVLIPTGNGAAILTGTPTNADVGDHGVTLEVTDGFATAVQSFTITVANVNDAPTFASTAVTAADEDAPYTYAISASDIDAGETAGLVLTATVKPAWLTLTANGPGSWTLSGTPTNAEVGSHDVTLTLGDGTTSVAQVFTIVVSNTNDSPTDIALSASSVAENQPANTVVGTLSATDVDVGDTATFTLVAGAGSSGNGSFQIAGTQLRTSAALDFEAQSTYSIRVRVTDSANATFEEIFTITVTDTPDAPVASALAFDVVGNTELVAKNGAKSASNAGAIFTTSNVDLRTNATDQDSPVASLTASVVTAPTNGTVVVHPDGSFRYVPAPGFVGSDTFTYRLDDGAATSAPATVSLTVGGRVWYLNTRTNADAPGAMNPVGGNGTSVDPFDTIAAYEMANASLAGDTIYLFQGDEAYVTSDADGLTLLASQRLVGQAAPLTVGVVVLADGVPGARPVIQSTTGRSVTLGSGNEARGLVVSTASGAGLYATARTGGTFVDVSCVATAGGSAVLLDAHTGPVTYTTGEIAAMGSGAAGIRLIGGSANLTFTGIALSTSATALAITGGASVVGFDATSSLSNTLGTAIQVTSVSGGSLSFLGPIAVSALAANTDGLSLVPNAAYTASFGGAVSVQNAGRDAIVLGSFLSGSMVTFSGSTTVAGANDEGLTIDTTGTNTPTFTFADLQITGAASNAARVSGGRPTVSATLRAGTGIGATGTGRIALVENVSGGTVLFQNGPITSTGRGIAVQNVTASSTVRFDSPVTIASSSATGVSITNALPGTVRFESLTVTTTGQTGVAASSLGTLHVTTGSITSTTAKALELLSVGANVTLTRISSTASPTDGLYLDAVTGTLTVSDGDAGTADDVRVLNPVARGIHLNSCTANVTLASIDVDGAGQAGVRLANLTGPFTASAGSVDASAGPELESFGGSGAVTFGATITSGGVGSSVSIESRTGGNVSISGAVSDAGTGVRMANNAAGAITLSGPLSLSTTTNDAIQLSSNGATAMTFGPQPIVISTSSGMGLSASGGGTLAVTGSSNTISSGIGRAVSISGMTIGAGHVTFRSVAANGAPNGIRLSNNGGTGAFNVAGTGGAGTGGTLQGCTGNCVELGGVSNVNLGSMNITGSQANGIGSTGPVSGLTITGCSITNNGNAVDEGGIRLVNGLRGTSSINNTTVTGSAENAVEIVNTMGTSTLTVTGSSFTSPQPAFGADGFFLETSGSALTTVSFAGCTFTGNLSDQLQVSAIGTSTANVTVGTSTFGTAPRAITFATGGSATLAFSLAGNTLTGAGIAGTVGIRLVTLSDTMPASMLRGTITNHASFGGWDFGISIDQRGQGQLRTAITNNTLSSIRSRGIDFISGAVPGDASQAHLTITGNAVTTDAALGGQALAADATYATSVCTNVRDNTFSSPGNEVQLRQLDTLNAFRLESGPTDCGGPCASPVAHLAARNAGTVATTTNVILAASGACQLP